MQPWKSQSSFESSGDFNSSGPLVTVTATPSVAPSPAPLLFGQPVEVGGLDVRHRFLRDDDFYYYIGENEGL